MDKEKLITIVIGLGVGITIASLYFAAVKFLPNLHFNLPKFVFNSTSTPQEKSTTTIPSPQTTGEKFTVTEPDDETTTKDTPLTVAGKSLPGTKVLVYANADEKIASADAQGKFSASIKLEEGENAISVTSLADPNNLITIKRNVILEINL